MALKIDSKYAMAIAYKGLALGEIGLLKEAIKCFNYALRIDKKYDLALSNKAIAIQLLKANYKLKPKLQKP
jgi:tetratricopeptide (TPR) repeat protein